MMSILPNESIAFLTSSSAAPGLVRSPANTAVSPLISPAACSATSPSRSLIRTCAPCATSSSAVARPMPRAEPVTIADLPSSTPIALWSPCVDQGDEVISGRRGSTTSPPQDLHAQARGFGPERALRRRLSRTRGSSLRQHLEANAERPVCTRCPAVTRDELQIVLQCGQRYQPVVGGSAADVRGREPSESGGMSCGDERDVC